MPKLTDSEKEVHMLDLQPFRACRYNPEKVAADNVICPPYDVISAEKQAEYYERSPQNAIRLVLNKREDGDSESNNTYTRARDFFNQWIQDGILIKDPKPCFYVYRQSFSHPASGEKIERLSLLSRIKAEPFEKGIVIPHEKTLKGPKADRLKLMETAEANFSPVFGLFEDTDGEIYAMLKKEIAAGKPAFEAHDEAGIFHGLWVISDDETIQEIQKLMSVKKVYIADGHHRYETAVEYARQRRLKDGNPDEAKPYDYALMALVSFSDPGFLLLPTHRLLRQVPFSDGEILRRLESYFSFTKMDAREIEGAVLSAEDEPMRFGLVLASGCWLLTLKDKKSPREATGLLKPDVWFDLNVNVLGHFVFAKLLEIPEEKWEEILCFEHEAAPSVRLVQDGKAQAAFLLKAPGISMLEKLGAEGERMPQKSTYFYPKLASGIVFNPHC